jgi:hypothetical protein
VKKKSVAKKLGKNWEKIENLTFFLNNIFLNIFLIFNLKPNFKLDFFFILKFEI